MTITIHNNDCINVMNKMCAKTISTILTSPPYNMTKRKGGPSDIGRYDVYVDWKTETEYLDWTVNIFNNFERVLKDDGVILYNFSYSIENPSLPYKLVSEIESKTNLKLVDTIIWKKQNCMPFPANKYRLCRIWEYVFVFVKNIKDFNINKKITKISDTGQKYYEVINNFVEAPNNDGVCKLNRATYSVELCTKLLNIYGSGIVFDPFMGSGTTGVACKKLNYDFIGSEISKEQTEYAEKRINEA